MKALFAAVATAAPLVAGFGVNADSQSTTPAAETLIARNEVQVALIEQERIVCEQVVDKNWVANKCYDDKKK